MKVLSFETDKVFTMEKGFRMSYLLQSHFDKMMFGKMSLKEKS
jgi:hypothetical protein